MLCCASNRYEKLKSRIKVLEDKVENNAENIHKLSKKQSGKTIEYDAG
jgi:tetrahydromethanopterin S-methyltransferase subunit G